jgi:hypothetical protein
MSDARFPSIFRANVLVTGSEGLSVSAGGIGAGLTAAEMGAIGTGDVVADNKMAVNTTVADGTNDLHVVGQTGVTGAIVVGSSEITNTAAGDIMTDGRITVGVTGDASTTIGDNLLYVNGDAAITGNLYATVDFTIGDDLTVNGNLVVLNDVTMGTGAADDLLHANMGMAYVNALGTKLELNGTADNEGVYLNADTLTTLHMSGIANSEVIHVNADTAKIALDGTGGAEQIYMNAGSTADISISGTTGSEVVFANADSTQMWIDGSANNILFTAADVNFSDDVTITGDLYLQGGLQLPQMQSEVVTLANSALATRTTLTGGQIPDEGMLLIMVSSNSNVAPTGTFIASKPNTAVAGVVSTIFSGPSVVGAGGESDICTLDVEWNAGATTPSIYYSTLAVAANGVSHDYGVATMIASGPTTT